MKLVDANVLLYAVNQDDPKHEEARSWLDDALSGAETIGFAWLVLLAFWRISTKPSIFPRPLSPSEAADRIGAWTAVRSSVIVEPTRRHLDLVAGLLQGVGTGGNLVNDAHLAALALEHDAVIATYDGDFGRFLGVRTEHPAQSR